MEIQTLLVLLILAAAAAFLGRRALVAARAVKRAKDDPGCGSGCGCGKE